MKRENSSVYRIGVLIYSLLFFLTIWGGFVLLSLVLDEPEEVAISFENTIPRSPSLLDIAEREDFGLKCIKTETYPNVERVPAYVDGNCIKEELDCDDDACYSFSKTNTPRDCLYYFRIRVDLGGMATMDWYDEVQLSAINPICQVAFYDLGCVVGEQVYLGNQTFCVEEAIIRDTMYIIE